MTVDPVSYACVACSEMYARDTLGIYHCRNCGLRYSGQSAGYGNAIQGMDALARVNYKIVADALAEAMRIRGTRILDVGSAEGGFTEIMLQHGATCLGLEPDANAATDALTKGLPVQLDSFEAFESEEKAYDAIIFNDVFEHMQDPVLVLEKSNRLLRSGGFVLINAPVSGGVIFRIAELAARVGLISPHRRMWAYGLSSPHVYFYNEKSLRILLDHHGFEYIGSGRLKALLANGMYRRVRSTYGPASALLISGLANVFVWVSAFFPPDVSYFLFKKKT